MTIEKLFQDGLTFNFAIIIQYNGVSLYKVPKLNVKYIMLQQPIT